MGDFRDRLELSGQWMPHADKNQVIVARIDFIVYIILQIKINDELETVFQ